MRTLLAALLCTLALAGCVTSGPPPSPLAKAQTAEQVCATVDAVARSRNIVALGSMAMLGPAGQRIAVALTQPEACIVTETVKVAAGLCMDASRVPLSAIPPVAGIDWSTCGFAVNESPILRPEVVLVTHAVVADLYQSALLFSGLPDKDAVGYGIACGAGLAAEWVVNEALLELTADADGAVTRFPGATVDPKMCEAYQASRAWALLHSHLPAWSPTPAGFAR